MNFRQDVEKQEREKPKLQKFQNFEGTWEQYKIYLHKHGALSPNLQPETERHTEYLESKA